MMVLEQWVIVRTQIPGWLRASQGAINHLTQRGTVDRPCVDHQSDEPLRVLIHEDQDSVGF